MPKSTVYQGNQFISRRERQSSVVIYNRKAAEVDKEAVYSSRTLSNVKIDMSLNSGFTTAGVQKLATCHLYVELRDGNPGYVNYQSWDETKADQWTVQPGKDYFVANDKKFVINSLVEKYNINGKIDILEIVGE